MTVYQQGKRTGVLQFNLSYTFFGLKTMGSAEILMDKTIDDKLMYKPNDDKQFNPPRHF